jgi:hypothetical protein
MLMTPTVSQFRKRDKLLWNLSATNVSLTYKVRYISGIFPMRKLWNEREVRKNWYIQISGFRKWESKVMGKSNERSKF